MFCDLIPATGDGMNGAQLIAFARSRQDYHRKRITKPTKRVKVLDADPAPLQLAPPILAPLPPKHHPLRPSDLRRETNPHVVVSTPWKQPSLREIAKLVCAFHQVTDTDFFSDRRNNKSVYARCHFWFLARKFTGRSLPEMGRFVNRDHTTAVSGINTWPEKRRQMKAGKVLK